MQISMINDCYDENARIRQISRAGALFPNASVECFAVHDELEAAGMLVDALDAFEGREGIVMANVAPRNGEAKRFPNGTPFGYFWVGRTLVVSSVDGLVLSLCKKLGLIENFELLDIKRVMDFISDQELDAMTKERIINTQFRSFNFLPRAADWVWRHYDLPRVKYDLANIMDAPDAVWYIDNFGNVKTTLLGNGRKFRNGDEIGITVNGRESKLEYYARLKDLPDKKLGVVEGSSGIGNQRFLEIILQGGNAAMKLGLGNGDIIRL